MTNLYMNMKTLILCSLVLVIFHHVETIPVSSSFYLAPTLWWKKLVYKSDRTIDPRDEELNHRLINER
jgi:hypothetical protein